MIEPDINEQMARFAPSQNPADPGFDAIEKAVAGMSGVPMPKPEPVDMDIDRAVQDIAAQRRQDMASSLMAASEVNPDEAAQADALGRRFGVGQDIALRNMSEMRRQAMIQDTERMDLLRKDPVLARYIADREFAAQASDDVGVLSMLRPMVLEAATLQTPGGFFRVVGRGYERGQIVSELGDIGAKTFFGFAEQGDFDRAKQLQDRMQQLGQQGLLGSTAEMIAQNAGQLRTIGTTAAGGAAIGSFFGPPGLVIGGGLGAAAGIVIGTGTMEAGNLYLDMRDKGVSDDAAIPAAIAGGFLNGVIEVVGMKIASAPFKALASKVIREEVSKAIAQPTMRSALIAAGKAYGLQVGGEGFEEGLQEIVAIASEEIAKAADGIDSETSLREATGRVIEAFAYGGMASALLGGIGPGANLVVDLRRANATQRQQAFFDGLVENRKESKLAQRNPQGYERFLAAQAKDTPAETIYVDAATARDILAQSGTTTAQLEDILPGIRERLEKAVETGGDVTIPTSQFGARLANTELGNALLPHMRLSPEAMSATEAQAFEAQRQAVVEEARTILATKQEADAAFVAEAQQVEDEAFEQVRAVGQFPDIEARTIAKLRQAMVVVDAAEAGMTPAQYQRERGVPLQVRGVQGEVAAVAPLEQPDQFDQAGQRRTDTPTFRTWFQKSKVASASGKPIVVYHGTNASDFEAFDPARAGTNVGRNISGFYFADEEQNARGYGSRVIPVYLSIQRPLVVDYNGLNWDGIDIDEETGQEVQAFPPIDQIVEEAKRDGYDGVIAMNVSDVGVDGDERIVGTTFVAFRPEQIKAVDNRGTWSPTTANMFEQAAMSDETQSMNAAVEAASDDVAKANSQPEIPQAIDNAAALDEVGRMATGQTWAKGRDLKQAIQNRVLSLAANAGVNLGLDTPQTTEYLTRIGYRDALYALRQNPNSVGWYDEKTRQAIAVMALVHPELLTDENARFAFTWALAVTSNGIKVDKNFELADSVYRMYKATGKMPTDLTAGQAQAAINRSLGMFNELRDAWGIDNLRRFAQTEYTIQELRYIVDDFDAGGEFAETTVKGAGILGPKIGNGFFSNLYGDFRSLTMDRWLIRTWGRWTGTLINLMPVQTQKARARLEAAVNSLDDETRTSIASILRDQISKSQQQQLGVIDALAAGEAADLDVLSTVIQKASMDKEARAALNESMAGQEIRKAGNSLAKYLDGQKEAPAGPGERVQIRNVFASILQELQKLPEYADLTMADLQAALWYAEKRLYETAKEDIQVDEESIEGYADDEAPDYANAASNVARASGVSDKRIQETLTKESNSERSRRARLQDEQGQPIEARDQGAARGFTAKEKRSFNGAAVIRNHRASRGGNAGQPWAYQRSSSKADAKPRRVKKLGASVVAKFNSDKRLRNALASAGGTARPFSAPSYLELEKTENSAQAFHKLITESKEKNAFGASVYVYPVGDYESMRLFVSEDLKSGFALKQDGDIVSVFSMADSGAIHGIMQMAVSQGGRKLDAFETVLPYLYAPHGFRVASRLRWDESQKPEGWDKQTFKDFNGGEPDVVFMVYDPTYYGQHSKKDGKVAKSYDAAVRAQTREVEKIAQGSQFQQAMPSPGPARGGFDPRTLNVLVGKGGDVSTLAHELIHLRVAEYLRMARGTTPPARVNADLETLFGFMGVEGATFQERLDNYETMTIDQRRPLEEKVTYNFEVYLYEGKAPSVELRGVFDRLAAWMRRVYKSIRDDLNAIYRREFGTDLPILTPEVRSVFDRMLASEEQIKRQEAIEGMKGLFQTQAESGMGDAEWAAYQAMQQEATEAAVTDLNTASMRQVQWLGNARARILRDLQKKHDAKRKEVTAEVAAAIKVEPVYRAMTYLRYGRFVDTDGAEVEVEGTHRLDIEKVRAMYAGLPSAEGVELIRATGMAVPANVRPDITPLGTGKYGMLGRDGLDPDMVAEMFGYSSGDEMVRALLAAKPMKDAVAERTDAEMLRRYGDMNTPAALEAEVQKALHNEARARFVAVELRHIAKATQPVRVMLETAKQVAADMISDTTIRDLRPGEFVAAEARAARDAERIQRTYGITEPAPELAQRYGTDRQQALIRAKRAQLYQNQLAAEALRVKEYVDKQVKYLRGVMRDSNVKRMGAAAADQVASLLERFEVAPVSLKRLDERRSMAKYLADLEAAGVVPDIAEEIANEARRVNYKELKVSEFRDLVDAVKQIEHIGKNEQKMRLAEERAAFEEVRDDVVTRIRAVGKVRELQIDPRTPLTGIGRTAAFLRGFAAQHLKAASIARILDGGKEDGPLWNAIIRTANDASDMETRMRAEASLKLGEILKPVFALGSMGGKGMYFQSIGRSLNREARIAIALNLGNDGNRQRLLDGEGWTLEQLQPVLESLTEAEWLAVQKVWDFIDGYRPEIAAKERRLYGKEPEWVKPTPFTVRTSDGKEVALQGGYYPVKYDPVASDRVATVDAAEEAKRDLQGAYTAATTRRSFVKARAKEVRDRPILYTLDAAFSGVNDVIHDLAWHEWLISTNRLLRDTQFANAVRETRGPEFLKQLRDWSKDNATGARGQQVAGEAVLSWLRQGISASGLGFNVVSAAMQITGFNQSIVRVGAKYVGQGIVQFSTSPFESAKTVAEKSSFMAERGRTQFREINEIKNRVRGQTEVARRVTAGTYFLMMNMQRSVDIPTWLGAYQKALDAGKDDAKAVALADQAVRDSQGSGLVSDLAAMERGGPAMKLFTVFYSYMNTVYNMTAVQTMTARGKGKLAADYAMLLVVPVVLGYAIKSVIQPDAGDDELDPEALARKLAAEELSYLMGTMVIVREFGGAAQLLTGAEGVRMGYGGPAGLRAVGEVYGLATQAGQLEFDRAFRRAAINTLGAFTGLPSAQINRTIDGIEALVEGEVEGPSAVLAPLTGVQR
jgi:hypothetical protein